MRILSTALLTALLIVLGDIGLTLADKEPLSSIYGAIQQGRAEDDLEDLESSYPSRANLRAIAGVDGAAAKARVLAQGFKSLMRHGRAVGRITIPRINLEAVLIEGTDTASLRKGPGRYEETPLPGEGGTSAIAGHRTTYLGPFRDIDQMEEGDQITLEMPYASLIYEVESTAITDPSEVRVIRDVGRERLVLTACHPRYGVAQRFVVFARLVRLFIVTASPTGQRD